MEELGAAVASADGVTVALDIDEWTEKRNKCTQPLLNNTDDLPTDIEGERVKPTFQTLFENHDKYFLELLKDSYGSCSPTYIASLFIDDSLLSLMVEFTTKNDKK